MPARRTAIAALVAFLALCGSFAQGGESATGGLVASGGQAASGGESATASLSISFYDKRMYVPGDAIPVKVTIRNDSPVAYRFKLAEEHRLSVSFSVMTASNRALEASDSWKRAMASDSPAFYRELAIQPGEEYSFIEDLRDHVALTEPGAYLVRCSFWPELSSRAASASALPSNILTLSLRPGAPSPLASTAFSAQTGELLKAERLAPDEVVRRTIVARQKSQWNEFFLYLDVERLLRANPERKRSYDRESDDGRRRMLEAYRIDLMAATVDSDIVVVPSSFEISETRYGSTRGTVIVVQKFAYPGFHMVKEYTYDMEKRDDIWYIVGYTVLNKGSE